ncbi:hypothetical protein [Phocaeicola salanitronis]|uniref:hypothetical protein n=1 Tax=Phocaeicola salanitronis TaxID=376805 RepID=UPI0025A49DA9|nr:hypothetical protein [Phocaeicola salanitronis]MDM8307209.1 hypothetical protein [Phocaeicola salanitronis]
MKRLNDAIHACQALGSGKSHAIHVRQALGSGKSHAIHVRQALGSGESHAIHVRQALFREKQGVREKHKAVGAYRIRPNAPASPRGCFQGVCDTPLQTQRNRALKRLNDT